jgi:hypothetical protein
MNSYEIISIIGAIVLGFLVIKFTLESVPKHDNKHE